MPKDRRLAAIMFTDIVGYTALMGKDEDRAFEVLHKNREIHSTLIEQHDGTLIKEMGDGMLISFDQSSEAVQCAIDIQQRASKELKAKIRIGIHLGDITFESDDVFGDGVNIASRIQSITDPGGIYLSDSLQKSIRGKSSIRTKYLGEFNLKNVDYLVKTYAVQGAGLPVPTAAKIKSLKKKTLKDRLFRSAISYIILLILLVSIVWGIRSNFFIDESEKPTLLIFPPENYTGSDTIDYLISGIHRSLIGEIGKIGELNIISPYTSKWYKDSGKSLKEISSAENVDYIAQPALSCIGDNVCLNFIMTKIGSKEKQILMEDFYSEKSQIFNMYNEITKEISKKINIILSPEEESLLAESRKVNPIAYDLYMKGQVYNDQMSKDDLEKAAQYFNLAIERDPDWAPLYARMASVVARQYQMGFVSRSIAIQKQKEYFNKALELDPNSSDAHNQKAGTEAWVEWNWEKAEKEFLKSIELNPNNAGSHMFYAHLLTNLRRTDEALHHAKIAEELDPLNPLNLGLCAMVLIEAGECQAAITYIEKGLSIEPNHYFTRPKMIRALKCIGDYDRWFELWKQINYALLEEYEVAASFEKIFQESGWLAVTEEAIKVYEEVWAKDGHMNAMRQADNYLAVKKYDKALDYYEKAYEIHSPSLPYISGRKTFNEMKDNPRYIALLKKMNLPIE